MRQVLAVLRTPTKRCSNHLRFLSRTDVRVQSNLVAAIPLCDRVTDLNGSSVVRTLPHVTSTHSCSSLYPRCRPRPECRCAGGISNRLVASFPIQEKQFGTESTENAVDVRRVGRLGAFLLAFVVVAQCWINPSM